MALVLVAFAPTSGIAVGAPSGTAAPISSASSPHGSSDPGPCVQSTSHCGGTGSTVAGAALGAALLFVLGDTVASRTRARRVRRRPRAGGALPSGIRALVLRPPRLSSLHI